MGTDKFSCCDSLTGITLAIGALLLGRVIARCCRVSAGGLDITLGGPTVLVGSVGTLGTADGPEVGEAIWSSRSVAPCCRKSLSAREGALVEAILSISITREISSVAL